VHGCRPLRAAHLDTKHGRGQAAAWVKLMCMASPAGSAIHLMKM